MLAVLRNFRPTFVFVRMTESGAYWRLPEQQPLEDGTDFYRALLAEQEEWERFFAEGMQLEVPEARVNDSAKASIVRALISEIGNHPKCGVGVYWGAEHDTFPPPTILLNLCLLDWGFSGEVKARFSYYLSHYIKPDGTFDYYGPAISEYGQMLTVAARVRASNRRHELVPGKPPGLTADYGVARSADSGQPQARST